MQYEIDHLDEVIGYDQEFETFAAANGAPDLPRTVIGTSIWGHVSGAAVIEIYQRLFSRVRRTLVTASIPFRCDSPTVIRKMSMSVSISDSRSRLVIETKLLEEIPRESIEQPKVSAYPAEGLLTMCAWCLRVEHQSEWWELEDAHELANHSVEFGLREVSHGLCPSCLDSVIKGRKRRK